MADEINAQSPAPNVSSLNGKFRWDQGSGLQQFSSTALAVTPADPTTEVKDSVVIQSVIDTMEDIGGGVIFLRNGTYLLDEDIVIPSHTVLLGETADGVVIDFQGGAFQLKAEGTDPYSDGTVAVTNLDDEVVGTGTGWTSEMVGRSILISGIYFVITAVTDATHLTIESPFDAPDVSGGEYVIAEVVGQILFKDLTVQNSTHDDGAVMFRYVSDGDMEGVSAYDSHTGFNFEACSFVAAEDIVAIGCSDFGIRVVQGGVWTFTDFAVLACGTGMYLEQFTGASINNATITLSDSHGIEGVDSHNWSLYDMTVGSNGGDGLRLTGCEVIMVSSIDFQNNTGNGVTLTTDNDNNVITAVVLRDNAWGIQIDDSTNNDNVINGVIYDNNGSGTVDDNGTDTVIISGSSSGTNTGDQNLFSTIAVSGQSNVVADTTSDTLTLAAGTNVTLTTNATTDTVTITSSGGGSATPGGADQDVQFNDAGAFGGDDAFIYDSSTGLMEVPRIATDEVIAPVDLVLGANGALWLINAAGTYLLDKGDEATQAIIDVTGISADRTLTVPNASGTILVNPVPVNLDMNGTELILDADADTSLTADTDDQIDVKINNADDFRFVANIFRALSGSTLETNTINETTAGSGVTIDSLLVEDGAPVYDGWIPTQLAAPNTVTYNGNRSYDLVFNSVDYTSTLSPGMRLKLTRTVTAPTQCTDLESGSSQYYSKTSPNKLTFTDDFTCMGWIKLESYVEGGIIARRNADTEGWSFGVTSDGRIQISSLRIASNNRAVTAAQSLPLGRWVHVAGTMDNSANAHTLYIDGVLVASTVSTNGTITALVQGTSALVVGAEKSAGTFPFDGKIAQAAVFDAVLSAATIRSYASQGLAGTETNLKSAYSFNNSIADLNTTTPNDLTAQGSAVATNADTPFANGATGTTEYAIIQKASFSTNTTLVAQVPDNGAIPTSGGVSAVSYSTMKIPYGFPGQEYKWVVEALNKTQGSQGSPVTGTWYNINSLSLTIPLGEWLAVYFIKSQINSGSGSLSVSSTLSTANNTESDQDLTSNGEGGATTTAGHSLTRSKTISLSAATPYYLNSKVVATGTTPTLYMRSDDAPTIIRVVNGYV